MDETDNCPCGKPSEVGAHGIRDGVVYDEYYCEDCYNQVRRRTYDQTDEGQSE